ncbi:MAG: RDD family protein [Hydrogenovibrio sp.]|nr:RDD family protein [Hydrogenovibrio sp.]
MQPIKILFAFFYDFLLLFGVWFICAVPFVIWQGDNLQTHPSTMLAFQVYLLAITYVYLTYFWTTTGQTPGLRVWRLRLQRNDGYLLTRHNANVRFILGILLVLVGWIWLLISKKHQSLQDILAHTEIVSTS